MGDRAANGGAIVDPAHDDAYYKAMSAVERPDRDHRACRFSGKFFAWSMLVLVCLAAAPTTHPTTTQSASLTLDLGNKQKLELVLIPAGTFKMGSPTTEPDRDDSESPQHRVKIGYWFYMGKYEVTQGQYQAVTGFNQSLFKGDDTLPEECVSWTDAQNFCDVVSKKTGQKVRLPSEAEWEYADRAGTTTPFWTGEDISSTQANFNGRAPYGKGAAGPHRDQTSPAGSFPPNPFGLYDTIGNVSEWCQDVFHDSYTGAPKDGSAWETGGDAEIRVYRGGAYDNDARPAADPPCDLPPSERTTATAGSGFGWWLR